jgi:hypothetical protein
MTALADGSFVCDRCGADCGNGGVFDALVISDISADDTMVLNLHFCRKTWQEDGTLRKGCDGVILSAANLKSFLETQPKYKRPERGTPPAPDPAETEE